MTDQTAQHPPTEGCYFCASDAELLRGVRLHDEGKPWDGRTVHFNLPASACPHFTKDALPGVSETPEVTR